MSGLLSTEAATTRLFFNTRWSSEEAGPSTESTDGVVSGLLSTEAATTRFLNKRSSEEGTSRDAELEEDSSSVRSRLIACCSWVLLVLSDRPRRVRGICPRWESSWADAQTIGKVRPRRNNLRVLEKIMFHGEFSFFCGLFEFRHLGIFISKSFFLSRKCG